jgi:hypothetical protein
MENQPFAYFFVLSTLNLVGNALVRSVIPTNLS